MCPGTEKSHQGITKRKTTDESSETSKEEARKTGKNEETLTIMSFIFYIRLVLCCSVMYIK